MGITEAMNGDIMMGKCSSISVVSLLCLIVYFLSSFGLANGFGHWINSQGMWYHSIILEKTTWNGLLIKRKLLTECNSGHLKRLIRFFSKASNTVRDGKVWTLVLRFKLPFCYALAPRCRISKFTLFVLMLVKKSVVFWMFLV